jgi:hypothetical protein
MDYRRDAAAQEARLLRRLHSLGLDMEVQRGDGNCQFRSLSACLHGSPAHHGHVRGRVAAHLRAHQSHFESFLGEEGFACYVSEMARDGTWGDELTLVRRCAE